MCYILCFCVLLTHVNRQIGPRSMVWTEKEVRKAFAYEFAEIGVLHETLAIPTSLTQNFVVVVI